MNLNFTNMSLREVSNTGKTWNLYIVEHLIMDTLNKEQNIKKKNNFKVPSLGSTF